MTELEFWKFAGWFGFAWLVVNGLVWLIKIVLLLKLKKTDSVGPVYRLRGPMKRCHDCPTCGEG